MNQQTAGLFFCFFLIFFAWVFVTWSLLLLRAPGFFFFLIWQGDVSAGEWPFDECDGLGIFLFCPALRSLDPESETAEKGQRLHNPRRTHLFNMFKYVCCILPCCSICSYLWTVWKSPFLLLQSELFLRPLPHFGKEHWQTYSGQWQHKSFYSIFLCNYTKCHEELPERLLKNHNHWNKSRMLWEFFCLYVSVHLTFSAESSCSYLVKVVAQAGDLLRYLTYLNFKWWLENELKYLPIRSTQNNRHKTGSGCKVW